MCVVRMVDLKGGCVVNIGAREDLLVQGWLV